MNDRGEIGYSREGELARADRVLLDPEQAALLSMLSQEERAAIYKEAQGESKVAPPVGKLMKSAYRFVNLKAKQSGEQ